eukprot:tig00020855_g14683.t1
MRPTGSTSAERRVPAGARIASGGRADRAGGSQAHWSRCAQPTRREQLEHPEGVGRARATVRALGGGARRSTLRSRLRSGLSTGGAEQAALGFRAGAPAAAGWAREAAGGAGVRGHGSGFAAESGAALSTTSLAESLVLAGWAGATGAKRGPWAGSLAVIGWVSRPGRLGGGDGGKARALGGLPRSHWRGLASRLAGRERQGQGAGPGRAPSRSLAGYVASPSPGIDLVGAGLGGTGSRAMRRAGAAAAGLGLATAGGLLSAYQALSQGKIGEAEFFDTFRDQMIMTVGSFGLQTGMSSALSALTKMRIGTVGGLGLSILAGAIAQVIVDIINGRSAEEIVKNFFKYPVDWAADTIQFIAQLSQQIYDWGVETWGDEASQLRNRINRLEGELGSGFVGVYDPSEAREMASLLAQELRLNEIKEPKELQAFIRALDNSINDYRTPKDQKTLLEIDRATVLFLSQYICTFGVLQYLRQNLRQNQSIKFD